MQSRFSKFLAATQIIGLLGLVFASSLSYADDVKITKVSNKVPEPVGLISLQAKESNLSSTSQDSYRSVEAGFPVMTVAPAFVCQDFEYIDGDGILQRGTKICSFNSLTELKPENIKAGVKIGSVVGTLASAVADCASDGQTDCKTSSTFAAIQAAGAEGKIVAGKSLGGIAGSFTVPAPSAVRASVGTYGAGSTSFIPTLGNCTSDGQVGCVAVGPSYAAAVTAGAASKLLVGQTLAGITGNITLPSVSKVLTGTTYGDPALALSGTLTLPLASNVKAGSSTYGDPGAALTPAYNPDFPLAANVRSNDTVNGVAGTLSNCTSDGQQSCVTDSSFKAANASLLTAGNIKAGVTLGGQLGAYPSATYPLSGADATLDLTAFGPAVAIGTYEFFDSAGTRYTGTIADGGTVTPTTSNQAIAAANTFYRQVIVAGDSNLDPTKIKDSIVIFGVTGSITGAPTNCIADGDANCLADGTNFKAAALTGAASKIISGQSLAGVAGNVTLPAVGKVLSGTQYGVAGTGQSGTLSLPLANTVLTGSADYGDSAAQLTPSYTPDFPLAANVRAGDTVNSVTGTLANCSGANQADCVATTTYKTMDLSAASATNDLSSANFNASIAGASSFEFWDSAGARHQLAGDTDLTAANIPAGTNIFGVAGTLPAMPPSCSSNGSQSCIATASYYAATACTADSSNCFLPSYVSSTQALKAISYDAINAGKASMRSSLTLSGIAGTLGDCGSDGAFGCVAVGPTYAAMLTTGAEDKIIAAQSLAGVSGTVTLPAAARVFSGIQYGVDGTAATGTLTLPAANSVLTGSGAYGDPGAQLTPSYSPDFPLAANVRASDTVNNVAGTLNDCSAGNQAGCVTTSTYKSMNLTSIGTETGLSAANFNATIRTAANFEFWDANGARHSVAGDSNLTAAKILSGENIFGVAGSVTAAPANCYSSGSQSCVATGSYFAAPACTANSSNCYVPSYVASTQPLKAISYDAIDAGKAAIRTSLTLSGIQGTLADCAAGNGVGCVTTASYKSLDLAALGSNSSTGLTTANLNTSLRTAANFEFWDASGARHQIAGDSDLTAANVANAVVIHGVTGTATLESHAPCSGANQTGCVATATYATMDLSAASASTDLTSGNFNTTIRAGTNFEFWDSAGARYQVAGDTDLAAANILSGTNIFGVAGSATASPANCSSNGSQSCVATGSYYAGTACAADGSNCFLPNYVTTTQPLKAISYDAINTGKAAIHTSLTLSGIAGTLADCSAANQSGCVATTSYKTMNLSAMGTDTGLTAANFQTRIATAANSEFWDAAGARHSITGDADLSIDKVKSGVVIHGVTGQYPSATYPLANNTGTTDLTLFVSQMTTNGTFEYFGSDGARYTGSGDSDLINGNIKNAVAIESLSLTGTNVVVAAMTCPTGWIKVPGDSAYGTGDFCVMKYEAKNVSSVATSQDASTPWVSITQTAAITACRALGTGYDMISNPQWMTIGSNVAARTANWTGGTVGTGYLFSGHNDDSPSSACAASSNDTLFYVETTCTPVSSGDTTEQRRTLTLSNSNVIWDLSGNVWEWVNYVNVGDKPGATDAWYEYTTVTGTTTTALKDLIPTNAVKAFWSDAWNSGKWIGQYYPGTNGSGGALVRGGPWSDGSNAGVFDAYMNHAPSGSSTAFGFRCVAAPSP